MFAEEYNKYNRAFAFFNKELFNNELPEVFLTFQRSKKAYGYFHAKQFERRDDDGVKVHEIALNPSAMRGRSAVGIFATLVHEMCHLWQEEFGKHVPDGNYHNKEWAAKMEEIGLIPSDTGQEGGKKTGSASSYARKYALNGLFAIDDTKDADFTNNGKEEPKPSLQRLVHGTETFKKVIERVKSTEVLLCDLEKHYTFDAKVKAEIELAIIQRKK